MQKNRQERSNALWLSVSPHLKGFDQRLLSQLAQWATVRRWEYCQTIDEACCPEGVIDALHDYLQSRAEAGDRNPIHLLGHGVSGAIGLLYARQYPQQVASLTLLSVGSQPAVNWQAHYYALRQLLPCSREMLLMHLSRLLFGSKPARFTKALATLLARDLDNNLTLHSLAHDSKIESGGVAMPLLVCNGTADMVISQQSTDWEQQMKPGDRLWHCEAGNHFFHFHHPEETARAIAQYWRAIAQTKPLNNQQTLQEEAIDSNTDYLLADQISFRPCG